MRLLLLRPRRRAAVSIPFAGRSRWRGAVLVEEVEGCEKSKKRSVDREARSIDAISEVLLSCFSMFFLSFPSLSCFPSRTTFFPRRRESTCPPLPIERRGRVLESRESAGRRRWKASDREFFFPFFVLVRSLSFRFCPLFSFLPSSPTSLMEFARRGRSASALTVGTGSLYDGEEREQEEELVVVDVEVEKRAKRK